MWVSLGDYSKTPYYERHCPSYLLSLDEQRALLPRLVGEAQLLGGVTAHHVGVVAGSDQQAAQQVAALEAVTCREETRMWKNRRVVFRVS